LNLTDRFIQSAKCDDGRRKDYPDNKVKGLELRVTAAGAKSWSLRYRRKSDGKLRRVTIGEYPVFSLSDARTEALRIKGEVAQRKDPAKLARRPNSGKPRTFGELAERYLTTHAAQKRTGFKDRQMLEKNVLPDLEGEPLETIERADITAILDRMIARGAAIQANRTFEVIRKVFNWGIEKGLSDAAPTFRMKAPSKAQSRDRVLSEKEIKIFWRRIIFAANMNWSTRTVLKLLLLTGQRVSEVAGIPRSEINYEKCEWHLPAERSKNNTANITPLSPLAVRLLKKAFARSDHAELAFPSPANDGPLINSSIARAMKRSEAVFGFDRPATPHDLRRTLASGLGELGFPRLVQDKILNHVSADRSTISGVYDRYSYLKEKREALEAWADHLQAIVFGKPRAAVVVRADLAPFRRAAKSPSPSPWAAR
jgi:integrase